MEEVAIKKKMKMKMKITVDGGHSSWEQKASSSPLCP